MNKMSEYEKLLRQMYRGETYIYFASFLGSYLHQGVTFSEFPGAIQYMIKVSRTENKEALLMELFTLKNKNDWKFVEDFVYKHCGKGLYEEELKLLFQWLIEGLTENLAKDKQ